MDQVVFRLDGIAYNVSVISLERSFSVMDTDKSGRTQDGAMYRDIVGTFFNYNMTVRERNGDHQALEALWEAVCDPNKASHVCEFPYGQNYLTQKMYITGGNQKLERMDPNRNHWGDIALSFIATKPEVVPG